MDDWHDRAACRDHPLRLWFPTNEDIHPYSEARPICRACPVREQCLSEALNEPTDAFGMRGGLTPKERGRLRRHQRSLGAGFVARCDRAAS